MILAVIGEIGGKAAALSRTLHAIADEGIATILQSGRLFAPESDNLHLDSLLRDFGVLALQSPEDRDVVFARRKAPHLIKKYGKDAHARLVALHERIPSATLEWIASLPRTRTCHLEGTRVLLCHGAPSGQDPPLGPGSSRQRLQREWERETADIILCGGVPAFELRLGEVLFAAPGPVHSPALGAAWLEVDTETRSCRRRQVPENNTSQNSPLGL